MNKFMARGAARLPEIESLRASHRRGAWSRSEIWSSNQIRSTSLTATISCITAIAPAGDRLFISEPLFGRISKHHNSHFSKRFPSPMVDLQVLRTPVLDHFTSLMSKFEIGKLGTIALRDGKYGLMTRLPPLPDNPGGQIGNTLISPEFRKAMESGIAIRHLHCRA